MATEKFPNVKQGTEETFYSSQPIYHKNLVAVYRAFQSQVYDAQSVLHPSCANDASPSKVFDNVTYVDLATEPMVSFRKNGLKAFGMDIRGYQPTEEHDVLILLNPAIDTDWASQHLQSGGYVLSNNYHGNASWMFKHPEQFTLWGVIDFVEPDRRKEDNRVVVSRNLEGLFDPVETLEELRDIRPVDYKFFTETSSNLLQEFGGELGITPEETYLRFRKMMGDSEVLPAKRKADRYIFVKR